MIEGLPTAPKWSESFTINYDTVYGYSIEYNAIGKPYQHARSVKNLLNTGCHFSDIPSCVYHIDELVKNAYKKADENVSAYEKALKQLEDEHINLIINEPKTKIVGTAEYKREYELRQKIDNYEFLLEKVKVTRAFIIALKEDVALMAHDFRVKL